MRGKSLLWGVLLCGALVGGCKRGDPSHSAWVELCTGFTSPSGGMLLARVHKGQRPEVPQEREATVRRIEQTLDALDANPLPDATLTLLVGDRKIKLRSNDHGYVDYFPLSGFGPPLLQLNVHLELEEASYRAPTWDGTLPVYDGGPGLGVISDIDDTVLDSNVVNKAKMVQNALTRSTWELQAFPDAARVLSDYARGRPLFYISGSPWGFRERIQGFFARSGFPDGPLLLKRFSSDPTFDQEAYKKKHIDGVVNSLPQKRWLLFGDSGERDPEIYRRLQQEQPDRVAAIYIHWVTADREPRNSPRFAGMTVFEHWNELPPPPSDATTAPRAPAAQTPAVIAPTRPGGGPTFPSHLSTHPPGDSPEPVRPPPT